MRKVLVVTAITAVGMALLSCSEPPAVSSPTTNRLVYEPSARIARTPLPPPEHDEASEPKATAEGWLASPRWAAVKGQDCIVVEQDAQAKFAAQAEAAKVKVGDCSKEDLDAGHEVSASQSNAHEPGSSPNSHEPEWPSGSEEPSPSNPYGSPATPPTEGSNGTIEPWTGAI
jgi:hypothetical protein